MSTAEAQTAPLDAGSIDTRVAAAARVTTAAEETVEAGLFTVTVTDALAPQADCANVSEADEITATVTSGPQPTSHTPTVTEFMSAVAAWPGPNEPGYVNLHYSLVNPKGANLPLLKGLGWPFRKVNDFVQRAAWINTTSNFKDVWFCTSLQSQMKQNSKGKPKAVRFAANAIGVKSIWIDVDVGPSEPGKKPKYPDIPAALKAVVTFVKSVGLPQPSAIVYSGGGIHFYWISKAPLTPAAWQPYASGLKNLLLANNILCDTGLTTDIARLLRVPGTFNHKPEYDAPRPVMLAPTPLKLYDFEHYLGFIREFAGPLSSPPLKPGHDLFAEGVTAATFGKPAFTINEPDLNAGIVREDALLNPEPIFKQCGFYKDALLTGGANFNNALWMYSVLGATFLENGNAIAHAVSKGHASYSPADTQALYDRKMADRADRGLGYPSCSTIAGAGCEACKTCPLFAKGKSPLNIRPDVTATINETGSPSGSTEITVNYVPGNEVACRTALDNVVAADLSTFTSGDILTILRVPDQEKPGLERWGGDLPGTTPALPADIIERAERLTWMASTGGKGDLRWKRCKPPRDFCTDYITQRRGRYAARLLVGIARVPFIRDDGTIRAEPGYDPETGIFVDRAPKLVVPDSPTLDDAKAAHRRVMKPYEFYVFEDRDNGPLQVLAASLTALQRPYMKTSPMFVVNGVQAGTGKGQVCRAIGRLALGTTAPFMSWGHDDDEFKKRLDTMLLASPAMLVMDNCNGRVLRGDTLEMILSEGEATIRQFNKLEAITVRSRTFLMANGNNIQISGDMSRRGIKINILPRSASPESDVFPFTPEDYVIKHRNALLSDYYTIMRAYRRAGMPSSGLPAVGSFSEWEHKVRDLIFWLTGHDLSGDFKKNKLDDPEQQEDTAVLSALHDYFQARWFKASEVDAALKRAAERRRLGASVSFCPGPKTTAAMKLNNTSTIDRLVQAMEDGTAPVDPDVLEEIRVYREDVAHVKKEATLLEATEQKFGVKQDYAKTLGNWASGVQKKFVDGLILHRQKDSHSKIYRFRVGVASSTAEE